MSTVSPWTETGPVLLKLGLLGRHLRDNGLAWTVLFALYYLTRSPALDRWLASLEHRYGRPGDHTGFRNRIIWDRADWSYGGEDADPQRKRSLIQEVIHQWFEPGRVILEIGPGAGRWSEALLPLASRLILVDVSERCLEMCRRRFVGHRNVDYHLTEGSSLSSLPEAFVDHVWSFDCFVHISGVDTRKYIAELARVMTPGGVGIIHHPNDSTKGGWRSHVTASLFASWLVHQGFQVLQQFDSWAGGRYAVKHHGDMITVFKRAEVGLPPSRRR